MSLADIVRNTGEKILPLGLAAMMFLTPNAKASSINQYNASYDEVGQTVRIYVDLTNDDSGAVYDSYETEIFRDLVTSLWANPENQAEYDMTRSKMLEDWSLNSSLLGGDISGSWSHDNSPYSNLVIDHVEGEPGEDYDEWNTAANSDTLQLALTIPLAQLDGDGDGWSSSDLNDYLIVQGQSVSNAGVGINGGFSWDGAGNPYTAQQVPEPTTTGLIGLGALALTYVRKRKKDQDT